MKIKLIYLLCAFTLLILHHSTFAHTNPSYIVDIYGTDRVSAETIKKLYDKELNHITHLLPTHSTSPAMKKTITDSISKITHGLTSKYKLSYVKISPVFYSNESPIYITIDTVEDKDKKRLSYFLPKQTHNIIDHSKLISTWLEYEKIGFELFFKHPIPIKNCPAFHCIFGFEHPSLKKYQHSFKSAELYKNSLARILRYDRDEIKRGAAAFILAHIKNDIELINFLIPSINDASAHVRNNVLRVIAETISHNNKINIPIKNIIEALNFPDTTDRNKALYIISSLIKNPNHAQYIKDHAGKTLIAILKLQQPNNHDFAYIILKSISGENFGERDYQSWENWLKNNVAKNR